MKDLNTKREANSIAFEINFKEKTQYNDLNGILGEIKAKKIFMMLDTGATDNFISSQLVEELGIDCYNIAEFEAATATGRVRINKGCKVNVKLKGKKINIYFYVIEDLHHEIILGNPFFIDQNIILNIKDGIVVINGNNHQLTKNSLLLRAESNCSVKQKSKECLNINTRGLSKIRQIQIDNAGCLDQLLCKGLNQFVLINHSTNDILATLMPVEVILNSEENSNCCFMLAET